MSCGLWEWLINLPTTYYVRIRNCLKTKLWKEFSVKCLGKYWSPTAIVSCPEVPPTPQLHRRHGDVSRIKRRRCACAGPGPAACATSSPATAAHTHAWRRQRVMPGGKMPSTHSNKASPKWQHSENTHTAMEQDVTVHANVNFHVWHARYIFQYTKHLKIHRKIGTLPLYGALGLLETCINFSLFPLRMHRNLVVVQNPLDA